jgi:hypothetical protein
MTKTASHLLKWNYMALAGETDVDAFISALETKTHQSFEFVRAHAMSGCASTLSSYRDAASLRVIASLISNPDRLWRIARFAS